MKRRTLLAVASWSVVFAGFSFAQPTITSVLDPYTGGTKLAPGGQAVITGTNLGTNPLVTVGGVNAFNLVPPQSGTTMTVQIPVTATLGSAVPVVVTTGAGPSTAFNVALVQYAPVLISTTSGSLTSPRHGNGVGVTAATPAAPGETINFYAIGLGPTSPVVNTGSVAANTTTTTTTTPTVTFGANAAVNASVSRLANGQGFFGATAPSGLVGSTQALIGIYLVSTTVPSGTATGSYPVTISIGGATSNAVNVAVGPAPTAPVISAIVGESGKTALCPGDIAILSGLNLGNTPTVTVGGKVAFNVTPPNNANEMTIQIPVDAALGAANVTLAQGGQTSAAFPITLSSTAPALPYGGNGIPFLPSHLNGTAVTQVSPATPGEQIFVAVYGLGLTNPVVPTGTAPNSNPGPSTTAAVTVNLAGLGPVSANASLTNQVGLYVVGFVVPTTLTTGGIPISISAGGATTGLVTMQVFTGPVITNVENAASNNSAALPNGGIAQGAIFIAIGSNLGPSTISVASSAFQSTTLSGTSIAVTVAGTTVAPTLYYTSAGQVAALLPSITPVGTGTITITYNGTVGLAAPITVVQNNVGIFTASSDGIGAGIVTYPDYSLVSPMKAANCGGVYTTCGAANPGDTLTVWATGLGPVSGNESAGAGLGVDMPNVKAQLLLGGVAQTIVFKGRGCCIGEDQIAFVVADNTPTGCAVPLAIQIGSQVSNYAVIAIAPKGSRTCTPSNPTFGSSVTSLLTTTTAPVPFGQIQLSRQPNINTQGQINGNIDSVNAFVANFTVPAALQPFIVSYLDDGPPGTCVVFNTPSIPDGGNYLTNFIVLDGGPSIKITGPNGSQTAALSGSDVSLGPGTFLSPGNYTITGTGGANVGTINAPFTIPTPPSLTGLTNGTNLNVTRANGVTLNWTGGTAGAIVRISGNQSTDSSNTVGASFKCFAAASAGTFTIPPSVLLPLPTGNFGGWDFKPFTFGTFSATGLSLGILQMSYDTVVFTTVQ
jgi:uncharacterized protein (TIGR03437 family)